MKTRSRSRRAALSLDALVLRARRVHGRARVRYRATTAAAAEEASRIQARPESRRQARHWAAPGGRLRSEASAYELAYDAVPCVQSRRPRAPRASSCSWRGASPWAGRPSSSGGLLTLQTEADETRGTRATTHDGVPIRGVGVGVGLAVCEKCCCPVRYTRERESSFS